jgi:hypothetical protein
MSQLNYSDFILDSETIQSRQQQNIRRQQLIKNHVIINGYIELNSDYYGMDSYYYDKTKKVMYKVCNVCDWSGNITPVFEISNDEHILKLNLLI